MVKATFADQVSEDSEVAYVKRIERSAVEDGIGGSGLHHVGESDVRKINPGKLHYIGYSREITVSCVLQSYSIKPATAFLASSTAVARQSFTTIQSN